MPKSGAIILILFVFLYSSNTIILALEADDILGQWINEDHDGRIKIYRCGKAYCGEIVWTRNGPAVDVNNPNPDLRNRPIIGLTIMNGFRYAGDSEWEGGELYDPKSGYTYKGKMKLAAPNTLELRGYVLIPLFGRTTSWARFEPK